MKTSGKLCALLLCVLIPGCGTLLRVQRFDPNKPAGAPFYTKVGVCNHQTSYLNPYWRLTLKITGESGVQTQEMAIISNAAYSGLDFGALLHELDKASPDTDSVMNAWNDLKQRNSFDPWSQTANLLLLENSSSLTSIVDYSSKFSINQGKPFSGSANADFKLGADGTLNEASGQVQDNTFATIVSALPISSLITSAAGVATKSGAAANETAKAVKFALVQEQRYVKTVYSQSTLADQPLCSVGPALTGNESNVAKIVSDAGTTTADTSNQDKSSDSIAISGTIKLPKSLLGVAPAPDTSADGKKASPSTPPDKPSASPPKQKQ